MVLCVDAGIPIYSRCENGSESDKTINRNMIPAMVERMKELRHDNFLYVGDSALITKENLTLMDDWKSGFRYVSRLPSVYKECGRAISEAVREGITHDLGTLSDEPSTPKRKPAHYHGFETVVDLHGVWYRALVLHSDAYDERRIKKLERTLEGDRFEIEQHSVEQNFGFLKDPVFVNALYLKNPCRIEALRLVLVLALMVWRLMERTMRISLKQDESKVDGWIKRKTSRPTSFMMTTKFPAVIVIRTHKERFLAEPLDPIQEQYLRILGLSAAVFTDPHAACMLQSGPAVQLWEDSG